MKTLHLSIIVVTILLLVPVMMNNQVKALCMPTPDWPAAPCYGDPGYQPSKEKERQDWAPYYQYKGASWMEVMKTQMIEAMKNGTLEDWVTGNQSNYDVWRYYYVNDQAPFFRSSVSGLNDERPYFPPPLQQLTTGIASKDVACKKGLNLVIKAEDNFPACVKPDTAQKLIERGWATITVTKASFDVMQSNARQANMMMDLGNDTGIVNWKNQTYYFVTTNYTETTNAYPTQILFHDVLFTLFPSTFAGIPLGGCEGTHYLTNAKFSDGTSEILHVFVGSPSCGYNYTPIKLSTHTNPQSRFDIL